MDAIGYNMKLKKKEKMSSPRLIIMSSKGVDRFFISGKGSDGTEMYKVVSKVDFEKFKSQGLTVERKVKKSKSGGAKSGSRK